MGLAKDLDILMNLSPGRFVEPSETPDRLDAAVKTVAIEDIKSTIAGLDYTHLKIGAQLQRDLTGPEKAALEYMAVNAAAAEGRDHYGVEGTFRLACRPQVVEALLRELAYKDDTIQLLTRRLTEAQGKR